MVKAKIAEATLALAMLLSLAACFVRSDSPAATRSANSVPVVEEAATVAPTPTALPTAEAGPLDGAATPIPIYTFEVIAEYPHDPEAYTQGLVYVDGILYEGTGLYGRSSLRRVKLETGEVEQSVDLPGQYFGEGIAVFDGKIYQLTWQSRMGFTYDAQNFDLLGSFQYPTEGWGLTHDGHELIVSDGSATLYWRDAQTLVETGRVLVSDATGPVTSLNELEFVKGEVWANVWHRDRIARIDPESGQVVGWIDLAGLIAPEERNGPESVLNGIAYDAANDRLFVTGKLWPTLFEIRVKPNQ